MTPEQIEKAKAYVTRTNNQHLDYSTATMKAALAGDKREERKMSKLDQAKMWEYIGASTALRMLGIE